jgi:hypothetical protein
MSFLIRYQESLIRSIGKITLEFIRPLDKYPKSHVRRINLVMSMS